MQLSKSEFKHSVTDIGQPLRTINLKWPFSQLYCVENNFLTVKQFLVLFSIFTEFFVDKIHVLPYIKCLHYNMMCGCIGAVSYL